jgi:hypothetical protein
MYVGVYTAFGINSSGRSPRNFGGSPPFCQKISKFWKILEIFGKFWKFLEIFGNFWKFFGKMSRRKKILEIFGNFWKNFQKLQKVGNFGGLNPPKRQIYGCNQVCNL